MSIRTQLTTPAQGRIESIAFVSHLTARKARQAAVSAFRPVFLAVVLLSAVPTTAAQARDRMAVESTDLDSSWWEQLAALLVDSKETTTDPAAKDDLPETDDNTGGL